MKKLPKVAVLIAFGAASAGVNVSVARADGCPSGQGASFFDVAAGDSTVDRNDDGFICVSKRHGVEIDNNVPTHKKK